MTPGLKKAIESAQGLFDELSTQIEEYETTVCTLEKEITDLKEQVDELENTNRDLMDYIDELKLEILEAKKQITEAEHKSLNNMYFSNDQENKVVAKEVINNLYKE